MGFLIIVGLFCVKVVLWLGFFLSFFGKRRGEFWGLGFLWAKVGCFLVKLGRVFWLAPGFSGCFSLKVCVGFFWTK